MIELIRWISHIDPKKFCYSCVVFCEGVALHMGFTTGFDWNKIAEKFNILDRSIDGGIHCFYAILAGVSINIILDIYRTIKAKFINKKNKGANGD